jgi:hypothetical protein
MSAKAFAGGVNFAAGRTCAAGVRQVKEERESDQLLLNDGRVLVQAQ